MLTIGGLGFLLACVFGSYILSGGSMEPLIEAMPFELLTIGGAALGTFIMSNSMHDVKHTIGGFKKILKGATFGKTHYLELLSLLYYFVRLASTKGAMALEPHIEKPGDSAAFKLFPRILANHHATSMICDYLRMMGMNADDPHQIEDVMGRELKKTLHEELHGAHALQSMADAPAGARHRRRRAGRHQDHVPHQRAARRPGRDDRRRARRHLPRRAAGLRHGGPFAARLKGVVDEEAKYFEVIRAVLVTHLHGNAPQVSVETGRKMAPNQYMPTFQEVEEAVQSVKV